MAPSAPAHDLAVRASIDVGLRYSRFALSATEPVPALVAALNRAQPTILGSTRPCALLADEQLEGRLRISPGVVVTSSELCLPEVRERIRAAWSVEPHELYGATDGLWGATCEHTASTSPRTRPSSRSRTTGCS